MAARRATNQKFLPNVLTPMKEGDVTPIIPSLEWLPYSEACGSPQPETKPP